MSVRLVFITVSLCRSILRQMRIHFPAGSRVRDNVPLPLSWCLALSMLILGVQLPDAHPHVCISSIVGGGSSEFLVLGCPFLRAHFSAYALQADTLQVRNLSGPTQQGRFRHVIIVFEP